MPETADDLGDGNAKQIAQDNGAENRRYEKGKSQTDPRSGHDFHVRSKNQHQEPQEKVDEKQSPADFLEVLNERPSPLHSLAGLRSVEHPPCAMRNPKSSSLLQRLANRSAERLFENADLGNDAGDERVGCHIEGRVQG